MSRSEAWLPRNRLYNWTTLLQFRIGSYQKWRATKTIYLILYPNLQQLSIDYMLNSETTPFSPQKENEKEREQICTFRVEDSSEADISPKSCRSVPSWLKGMRTEPPALRESIVQEQRKDSFSLSSKFSSVLSKDSIDSSQFLLFICIEWLVNFLPLSSNRFQTWRTRILKVRNFYIQLSIKASGNRRKDSKSWKVHGAIE